MKKHVKGRVDALKALNGTLVGDHRLEIILEEGEEVRWYIKDPSVARDAKGGIVRSGIVNLVSGKGTKDAPPEIKKIFTS